MKYYRISEEELLELLADSLKLSVLDCDGVDNWGWYMAGKKDFMIRNFGKDLDFDEAAEIDLERCFSDKEIIE